MSDYQPIVIDNGSDTIKAGYAGDDEPSAIFHGIGHGHTLKHPIENGIVTNWDDMEAIWDHTFSHEHLRASPEKSPVLLTEPPLNPNSDRERMTQTMFETFNVPAMYLSVGPVLSLYSSGETIGLVFDSGHGVSHAVPIYEGYPLPLFIKKHDIAGNELTKYLTKVLRDNGHSSNVYSSNEIVRYIKEELCYVAFDFRHEMERATSVEIEKTYELPDGQEITIGEERFRCPEVLFNPGLIDDTITGNGIHQLINDVIMATDEDIHRDFYTNIVLSGGSTMFEGLEERLKHEISAITPGTNIIVENPPDKKFAVWIGGSILSSLSTFEKMWITRDEYEDAGPNIVHTKCY